jgi:hypothetical protein
MFERALDLCFTFTLGILCVTFSVICMRDLGFVGMTLFALGLYLAMLVLYMRLWWYLEQSEESESRDDGLAESLVRAMRFTDGESLERAVTTVILRLACQFNDRQPDEARELLRRLRSGVFEGECDRHDFSWFAESFNLADVRKARVRCIALGPKLDQILGQEQNQGS